MTLIPTSTQYVEEVAKAIAKDRLVRDAKFLLRESMGIDFEQAGITEDRLLNEFERMWASSDPESKQNRDDFTEDAKTAINRINLLLLTLEE